MVLPLSLDGCEILVSPVSLMQETHRARGWDFPSCYLEPCCLRFRAGDAGRRRPRQAVCRCPCALPGAWQRACGGRPIGNRIRLARRRGETLAQDFYPSGLPLHHLRTDTPRGGQGAPGARLLEGSHVFGPGGDGSREGGRDERDAHHVSPPPRVHPIVRLEDQNAPRRCPGPAGGAVAAMVASPL